MLFHLLYDVLRLKIRLLILLSSFLHLFCHYPFDLFKRNGCIVVVVNSDVILCRIEVLKPGSVNSGIVLSCVYMSEQLPHIFISAVKA